MQTFTAILAGLALLLGTPMLALGLFDGQTHNGMMLPSGAILFSAGVIGVAIMAHLEKPKPD
jgi:uncharacterized membrane protein AbrB (regulator of aidB expression)